MPLEMLGRTVQRRLVLSAASAHMPDFHGILHWREWFGPMRHRRRNYQMLPFQLVLWMAAVGTRLQRRNRHLWLQWALLVESRVPNVFAVFETW